MKYIDRIIASWKTVFTYHDIRVLLWIENYHTIRNFLKRREQQGVFQHIYKWIYTLYKPNKFELAVKIKKNSYISFETVLKKEWVIFQDYWNTLFLASDNTWEKTVWDITYRYLKLKDSILHNPLWMIHHWNYAIASPERAICDRLYLSKEYYFDSIEHINIKKIQKISKLYNKRVVLAVHKMIKNVA